MDKGIHMYKIRKYTTIILTQDMDTEPEVTELNARNKREHAAYLRL